MAMSKIESVEREMEKTRNKITELQNRLKELTARRTELENIEIVGVVRAMCMSRDELLNFLHTSRNTVAPDKTTLQNKYYEQEDDSDDEE